MYILNGRVLVRRNRTYENTKSNLNSLMALFGNGIKKK